MITFCSSIILTVVVLFPQKLDSPLFLNEIYDNSFFELLTLPEKLSSNPPPLPPPSIFLVALFLIFSFLCSTLYIIVSPLGHCLPFLDLQLLIIPLLSSNFSFIQR